MSATGPSAATRDEAILRDLIAKWAQAVRNEDLAGIRADHDPNILMFDVPPPLLSRGLEAYMATWQIFYPSQARPIEFYIEEVEFTASNEVAFATGIGRCSDIERNREKTDLKFRLTIGFRKQDGRWRIVHEHHSVPATD
jgi:uncharacterized protein (TIGR02246 family)